MQHLLSTTCVYCFTFFVASGQLTTKPNNVAAKVGSSVSLSCATDSGEDLKWDTYADNPAESQSIVYGSNWVLSQTKYELLTEPAGNYELTIKSVESTDAGKYSCKYNINSAISGSAEVIIFESDPTCASNVTKTKMVEGDYVRYSCEVKYKGKWAPVMEWKNTNRVVKAKDESTGNTVKYTYITALTPEDNGQAYSCRTYFDQPKPGTVAEGKADNIPITETVLSGYTSTQLTVYYGPRMLMVKPEQESYKPGDKLKITADSNPSARTYLWVNTASSDTMGTEDSITITDKTVGNQSLKIIVCNIIPIPSAKTTCKEHKFTVKLVDSDSDSDSAGAVVGGVHEVLFCIAIAIIVHG